MGLALARACANRGARVVIHGRDRARLDDVVRALRAGGRDVMSVASDVATWPGADALVRRALEAHGRIDLLVASAAIAVPRAPLWRVDPLELEAVVATNLLGPMWCARALLAWAVPRAHPVRLVHVSAAVATAPAAHVAAYAAAKAGLEGLTRALALDAGPPGVAITAVALAGHRTELARGMLSPPEHAALAPPEAAVPELLYAMTAPADEVHGRVLTAAPPDDPIDALA